MTCIQNGRFKMEVAWGDQNGNVGLGTGRLLTEETAVFWFFDPGNIELATKNLDACDFSGTFWVFAAGATNVEVDLGITDTELGVVRRWYNPLGQPFQTVTETGFFDCDGQPAALTSTENLQSDGALENTENVSAISDRGNHSEQAPADMQDKNLTQLVGSVNPLTDCTDNNTLCLSQNRFDVSVKYRTNQGPGTGFAVPLSTESGYFWFFAPGNIEILVKVLDACSFNNRFWVFGAGLTNLEVDLEVVDRVSGQKRVYRGEAGSGFEPVLDTGAFATCDA